MALFPLELDSLIEEYRAGSITYMELCRRSALGHLEIHWMLRPRGHDGPLRIRPGEAGDGFMRIAGPRAMSGREHTGGGQ